MQDFHDESSNDEEVDALALATALQQRGNLEAAEAVYQRIFEVVPDHPEALHYYGLLCHQRGESEKGIESIRRALCAAPTYAEAYNNLGNILRLLDRGDDALECYEKALALRPDLADAHSNLGALLIRRGKTDLAETHLRRAIELFPEHADAHHHLAQALMRQGRRDEAIAALSYAMMRRPYDGASYARLALLLGALGRVQEAEQICQRWVALDPDSALAKHLLASSSGKDVPERAADDTVRRLFDRFADSFDNVLDRLAYKAPLFVEEAIAKVLQPTGTLDVFDAGCGTGLCGPRLRPFARQLVGIDLSGSMLAKAKQRGLYDELVEGELGGVLAAREGQADLIASADTLCYFGALTTVCEAAFNSLRASGHFVFTVEQTERATPDGGYQLKPQGRYGHTQDYVRACLSGAGFEVVEIRPVSLRLEANVPVPGWLVTARKNAA